MTLKALYAFKKTVKKSHKLQESGGGGVIFLSNNHTVGSCYQKAALHRTIKQKQAFR